MNLTELAPILDTLSEGIIVVDASLQLVKVNRAAEEMLGAGCEGLVAPPFRESRNIGKINRAFKETISAVKPQHTPSSPFILFGSFHADGKTPYNYEQMPVQRALRGESVQNAEVFLRNQHKPDGVQLKINARPLTDAGGKIPYVVCAFTDQSAIHASEQRHNIFRQVFAQTQEAIVITDGSFIVQYANKAYWDLTGDVPESLLNKVFAPQQEALSEGTSWNEIQRIARQDGSWSGEFVTRRQSNELLPLWANLRSVIDANDHVTNYVLTLSDLTSLKSSQEELYRLLSEDAVTGLNNRRSFIEELEDMIERYGDQEKKFSLVFFDIKRFKEMNDSLGHQAGDKILQKVADRLSFIQKQDDEISRLGGDEFAMICAECANELDLALALESLRNSIESPMEIDGQVITPKISIGAAVFPDDGADALTLFKNADIALTSATKGGGNDTQLYTQAMNNNISRHFWVEHNLRNSFGAGQLIPFFQPQLNLENMKPEEAEVLIRWNHPQSGLISPAEFIPVAERTGLISQVTTEVIEASCKLYKEWRSLGMPLSCIAINISANLLLDAMFMSELYKTVENSGIPPANILIEITESSAMLEPVETAAVLRNMKDYGFTLAIDDFGTGYSSLAYLNKFAVDQVKIDQSFVKDLATSQESRSIVKAIIRMCEALGYETLAEGIETIEQAKILQEFGCKKLQGFLIARPLNQEEFLMFMRSNGQGMSFLP
jgi:diguanylate cyclase (GGDEF)-like protein/PAS domain S-box-containing protein